MLREARPVGPRAELIVSKSAAGKSVNYGSFSKIMTENLCRLHRIIRMEFEYLHGIKKVFGKVKAAYVLKTKHYAMKVYGGVVDDSVDSVLG
jgi:hypothetical protein